MRVLHAVALAGLLIALQAVLAVAAVPSGCPANAPVVTESAEQLQQGVDRITAFPTTLDPRVFNNVTEVFDGQMRPDVRAGSTASYEWDKLADLGIHVFLSVNGSMCPTTCKAPEGPVCEAACQYNELAKKHNKEIEMEQEASYMDAQGRTSPQPAPDTGVLINGLVAEVTIMTTKPPSQMPVNGTGLYSFTTDTWLMEPTVQADNWDRAEILGNVTQYVDEYNTLLCEYEAAKAAVLPDAPGALDFNCSRWSAFSRALRSYRGAGFDADLGSRSTSNLVFRLLRRISGKLCCLNIVDQPNAWKDQCDNLKFSLPNKLADGVAAASAPAPTAVPSSGGWQRGLPAAAFWAAAGAAAALLAA
ncbi:hypothetical protein COHA_001715 [Chlorella ohadii]|uniref:Uncharacterized protein n=1 Tax=Chlorella ohadii TaxID=2649997 RepID=A0AAD5H8J1_9CHLO|nr:hypothetical protein COHA_001715 [Chlorella ohadii]